MSERHPVSHALTNLPDDGLSTPVVKAHAKEKYRRIELITSMFAKVTRSKWTHRVYIDLFSGAGRAKLEKDIGTPEILPASPILALRAVPAFDRYIFNDSDPELIDALRERVRRDHKTADCRFLCGDSNASIDTILRELPPHSAKNKVLSLCVADPFQLEQLHLDTLRVVSNTFTDFLVLIPSYMDAHRNATHYLDAHNLVMEHVFADPNWRDAWHLAESSGRDFGAFVADHFGRQFQKLGYRYTDMTEYELVKNKRNKSPLYHLGYFSRHELGQKIWQAVQKYADPRNPGLFG